MAPAAVAAPEALRIVEVFQKGGEWTQVPWEGLKKGMIFRLRNPEGDLVDVGTEHEVSVAMEDAASEPSPAHASSEGRQAGEGPADHRLPPSPSRWRHLVGIKRFEQVIDERKARKMSQKAGA